ncbi:MAG: hypothetical protein EAZ36_02190 [Verrucomicrobia bacterium]|nr:MAG: hypothetical protein EAZ36_02190 [Verrucomicrobiota bacterium]
MDAIMPHGHPLRQSSRRWLLVIAFALGLSSLPLFAEFTMSDPVPYLENLPASNPYRAPLLRFATLPPTDRSALRAWIEADPAAPADPLAPRSSLSDSQRELATSLTSELVALASSPALTAAHWPLLPAPNDPENPAAIELPSVGLARELTRIVIKNADALPPSQAIDAYAAAAQLGRQQRGGATLIEELTGVAIENIAFTAAGRRLNDCSPADLKHLSEAWSKLGPLPSLTEALNGERDLFFRPMVERIIRPGLHALLAEGGDSTDPGSADVGFTRDLRLSALVDLGGGERQISLENTATKTTFTLRENATVEGILLVRLDFENRRAVIRRGTQEAEINLESKEIVERRHSSVQLREMLNGRDWLNGEGSGKKALDATLARARAHPGGVDAYCDELYIAAQQGIAAHANAAASARFQEDAVPPSDDPILALSLPMIGRLARSLNNSATSPIMLQAAIHYRLGALGVASDSPPPSDPWAEGEGAPFAREATPDGGFVLRSRYETGPDAPLSYKFAAPDADFVRAQK